MSKIVWLASYPKSGNTWTRIFLNNYLLDGNTPADINDLEESMHAGTRALFDRLTGLESSDLTAAEIDRVRPLMYGRWAEESEGLLFVKVHDAWRKNKDNVPIFPEAATKTAVYILRNPLDIVPSLANHSGLEKDEAIATLANEQHSLAASAQKLGRQLPQFVGSWHNHVLSWTRNATLPLHIMRYEDMHHTPTETFRQLLQAIDVPVNEARLAKAIRFSSFDQVKQQETAVGFKERMPGVASFFRRGKDGGWQTELTAEQIAAVCQNHQAVMQQFGYLESLGQPIVNYEKERS